MSYNYNTAIIECSSSNGEVFPSSIKGDILFYPLNDNQSILIGNSNVESGFKMKENKIGICLQGKQLVHDFQVGCKSSFENDLTMKDSKVLVLRSKGNGGLIEGSIMLHPEHYGTYYNTVADELKLKKVIENYSSHDALQKVRNIPVHVLKEKDSNRETSLGCLAQEIYPIFPECVSGYNAKSGNPLYNNKMIDYSKLVPLLIKSIQELDKRIDMISG